MTFLKLIVNLYLKVDFLFLFTFMKVNTDLSNDFAFILCFCFYQAIGPYPYRGEMNVALNQQPYGGMVPVIAMPVSSVNQ